MFSFNNNYAGGSVASSASSAALANDKKEQQTGGAVFGRVGTFQGSCPTAPTLGSVPFQAMKVLLPQTPVQLASVGKTFQNVPTNLGFLSVAKLGVANPLMSGTATAVQSHDQPANIKPANDDSIEQPGQSVKMLMQDLKDQKIGIEGFSSKMASEEVLLVGQARSDGDFYPSLVMTTEGKMRMLEVYSDANTADQATFEGGGKLDLKTYKVSDLVKKAPSGVGVVFNPRQEPTVAITPESMQGFGRAMGSGSK